MVSPDGSLAYVANSDDTVSVIDTGTNTVVRTVTIDPNPETGLHSLALSQGYTYPYRDDDRVYITDAADRTMRALAIAPSPAPQIPATTTPITVGSYPVNAAVVGNYAYVVNTGNSTISRIDTTTNTVVGDPIPVGSSATAVAASPAANRVYVADYYDNKVYAIDTNTNTVVDAFDVLIQQYEYAEWWNGLTDVEASRDGRRIFAVATDGNPLRLSIPRADPSSGLWPRAPTWRSAKTGACSMSPVARPSRCMTQRLWPESAKFTSAHLNSTGRARWP